MLPFTILRGITKNIDTTKKKQVNLLKDLNVKHVPPCVALYLNAAHKIIIKKHESIL